MNGSANSVYGDLMKLWFLPILASILTAVFFSSAAATTIPVEVLVVCPSTDGQTVPPTFTAPECETLPYWNVNPQGRELWAKANVEISKIQFAADEPVGFYISGKNASEVYLNGQLLGQNGTPAALKEEEIPGRIDSVFYVPQNLIIEGENTFAIRMSAHYGRIQFRFPIQWVGLADYREPTRYILNAYWPSLIPFGALIAGFLYFATASVTSRFRADHTMLALISFFAASQLFTEVYRGLVPYLYPAHDWRMVLVLLFSIGFGLCLAGHVIERYIKKRRKLIFGLVALAVMVAIVVTPGYDGKSGLAILVPTIMSAVIAGFATFKRKPFALVYFATLSLFAMVILAFPSRFLDAIFFYFVAALLLVMFIAQAMAIARERKQHEDERSKSRQLALSLEQAHQAKSHSVIKISGAGKLDVVVANDVAHCKGAGDYVEICLKDGREILHNGTLTQLEQELPSTFLRVHRSYLVNTAYVRSLTRESSGVGKLNLTTDAEIPVSRRIMPKVRSALA